MKSIQDGQDEQFNNAVLNWSKFRLGHPHWGHFIQKLAIFGLEDAAPYLVVIWSYLTMQKFHWGDGHFVQKFTVFN